MQIQYIAQSQNWSFYISPGRVQYADESLAALDAWHELKEYQKFDFFEFVADVMPVNMGSFCILSESMTPQLFCSHLYNCLTLFCLHSDDCVIPDCESTPEPWYYEVSDAWLDAFVMRIVQAQLDDENSSAQLIFDLMREEIEKQEQTKEL